MKKFRTLFVSALVLTMTVALCGCGGDKAGEGDAITVGIPQDIEDSLDPHTAVAAGTREVLFNVFEGLLKPDSNGDLKPAVASEYSIEDDIQDNHDTADNGRCLDHIRIFHDDLDNLCKSVEEI